MALILPQYISDNGTIAGVGLVLDPVSQQTVAHVFTLVPTNDRKGDGCDHRANVSTEMRAQGAAKTKGDSKINRFVGRP